MRPHRLSFVRFIGMLIEHCAGLVVSAPEDGDPAALQQDAVHVQGLAELTPVPFGVSPAFIGGLQCTGGEPGQPEVQPAARHLVSPRLPGDLWISGGDERLG